MIWGNLRDVSFPDLLQFLHLSGRSGTLYLERDDETAYVSFHNGRMASAWCPTSPPVVDLLQQSGKVSSGDVARARSMHEREHAARTLGQILLSISAVTRDSLRQAVANKMEQTVFELLSWQRGTFRFVVEEVRYDPDLLFAPNEVVLQVDMDTQVVLMEALRLSDERTRDSRPSLTKEAAAATARFAAKQGPKAVIDTPPPERPRVAPESPPPPAPPAPVAPQVGVESPAPGPTLAHVRELLRDIRSGLASSRLSLNLMGIVAQAADRGILFTARRDTMVVLTAFGRARDRELLSDTTHRLTLTYDPGGGFADCMRLEDPQTIDWDRVQLPEPLPGMLGMPASGHGLLFPVRGRRLIAVIYADNGTRAESIGNVDLLEIACGQFGLAIENEILRRHISRAR